MTEYYAELVAAYPLVSIEDPLYEDDWDGWKAITDRLGDQVQIVGDDLFVTNPERLPRGIDERHRQRPAGQGQPDRLADRDPRRRRAGPAQRLQLHDVPPLRRDRGRHHRRPRRRHNCGQIKTGAPARSERVAKYNQLLRIEEMLDDAAVYAGAGAFPRFAGATAQAERGLTGVDPTGRPGAAGGRTGAAPRRATRRGSSRAAVDAPGGHRDRVRPLGQRPRPESTALARRAARVAARRRPATGRAAPRSLRRMVVARLDPRAAGRHPGADAALVPAPAGRDRRAARTRRRAARDASSELRDEQARWHDPAYVEQQARERLHFVMPGERPTP